MKNTKYLSFTLFCFLFLMTISYAIEANAYPDNINNEDTFDFLVEVDDESTQQVNEVFNFSSIVFNSSSTGITIPGQIEFKKIYTTYTPTCPTSNPGCTATETSFTAYCFDGNKKYPEYNILYLNNKDGDTTKKNELFSISAVYQVFKLCQASSTCHIFDDLTGYKSILYKNADNTNSIDQPDAATLAAFDTGTTSVDASISSFTLFLKDSSLGTNGLITYTASDLATAIYGDSASSHITNNKLVVSFARDDFAYNKYSPTAMPSTLQYNKALWIVEHSYPILSLSQVLKKAGVNEATLYSEVSSLSGIANDDDNHDSLTAQVENYVYATTQYAIWKVIGEYYEVIASNKYYLGDSLIGSSQLNILYKYLIADHGVTSSYSTDTVQTTLHVTKPETELYKTLTNAYMYGPYKVTTDALYVGTINLALSQDVTGVTITDASGNTITSLAADGEEFYILVQKTAKNVDITVNLTSTNTTYVFSNSGNRGKIFLSESDLDQILGTGGSISTTNGTGSTTLSFNPKTGVEDIGTIFLVALIAFTLGYVVLRFKQNPIEEL